jgi:hypothetical protein
MQRYGDLGLKTNIWMISSLVCCDREADSRQKAGMNFIIVAKDGKGCLYILY